ncbi:hypothetical protein [Leptospira yasudae]|uniref:Uncharacterized protein n=1 Tax=Leptospira yasudae TaxID=2202201 RepID=A0A6N4QYQ1_9LEPT|nr:hypothetical protein [Leptospira yasudae]TGL78039.1 hypothetical protein EHQ72_10770 [Leptospira yasudae]TGL83233.1 hypothetical protein EHQ77_03005 [Leptospira yasudae]TGL84507.1 hypothetical protein EHQ83_10910 [Leptospira yasudae]
MSSVDFDEIIKEIQGRISDPDITELDALECLHATIYYKLEEVKDDIIKLKVCFAGSNLLRYIELTESYLKVEADEFVGIAELEDAPLLLFLVKSINWSLRDFMDMQIAIALIRFQLRYYQTIENVDLRRDFIKLLRLTVSASVGVIEGIRDDLEYAFHGMTEKGLNEEFNDLRIRITNWSILIMEELANLHKKRFQISYFNKINWVLKLQLRRFILS